MAGLVVFVALAASCLLLGGCVSSSTHAALEEEHAELQRKHAELEGRYAEQRRIIALQERQLRAAAREGSAREDGGE